MVTDMTVTANAARARSDPSAWINTFTGRRFYPLDADVGDIDILDIAHALACQARFSGMTREPYSIAQHSVYVSARVPPADALWGLLHDAPEAYLVDVPRPLKRTPAFTTYRLAEQRLMGLVCRRFGLDLREPASVRGADHRVLSTEARDLFAARHPDWRDHAEPYPDLAVTPWPWHQAEAAFLDTFRSLTGEAVP